MEIQVVDFKDSQSPALFAQSLHETGFGIIENHGIDQALIERAYAGWYDFFQSPERNDFLFNPETHEGYVPMELSETAKGCDLKDIKEFYHYYPHGRCPDHLRDLTNTLHSKLSNLAAVLLSWIEEHAPAEVKACFSMPLPEMVKDSKHTLYRILYYPPLTGNEASGSVRAAAHGDINFLTVLPAATAAGLQVQQDGKWCDVPVNPERIIINIGDMLSEASGGYYRSTLHRVVNPEGEAAKQPRISTPLFLHAHDEVVISERYTAQSYRYERFKELGLLGEEDDETA